MTSNAVVSLCTFLLFMILIFAPASVAVERMSSPLSAGKSCTAVIDSLGQVFFAGHLKAGAMEIEHYEFQKLPILNGHEIVQIAFGQSHVIFVDTLERVWTFGEGSLGQLGHGDNLNIDVPKQVETLSETRIIQIAAGEYFSLALDADGIIWFFGKEELNISHPPSTPKMISGIPNTLKVTRIAAGSDFSLALDNEGGLWSFCLLVKPKSCHRVHSLDAQKIPTIKNLVIVDIAAGLAHAGALDSAGGVWTWGTATQGRLGHGAENESCYELRKIKALKKNPAVKIAVGDFHTLVIDEKGHVWSFGYGDNGQLGHQNTISRFFPKRVRVLTPQNIRHVSAGSRHSVALDSDGQVWVFGLNDCHQLGRENLSVCHLPQMVTNLPPIQKDFAKTKNARGK